MDIDYLLGSFELPSDRPKWEAALLAELSREEPMSNPLPEQVCLTEPQRSRTAVILNFMRPATT